MGTLAACATKSAGESLGHSGSRAGSAATSVSASARVRDDARERMASRTRERALAEPRFAPYTRASLAPCAIRGSPAPLPRVPLSPRPTPPPSVRRNLASRGTPLHSWAARVPARALFPLPCALALSTPPRASSSAATPPAPRARCVASGAAGGGTHLSAPRSPRSLARPLGIPPYWVRFRRFSMGLNYLLEKAHANAF